MPLPLIKERDVDMKGNYDIRKLVLFCILLCGIAATVETIVLFLGIGKVSMTSLVAAVSFFLFLILWAIQEAVKTPGREKGLTGEKTVKPLSAEGRNPIQAGEMAQKRPAELSSHRENIYSLATGSQDISKTQTLQRCQSPDTGYVQQQYPEIQLYQKPQESQEGFSIEELSKIYDFSWSVSDEERKERLKKFLNKKDKLELTEKAKSEVNNLQRNTALLTITNDGGAEFFLYDNSYLVPSLETYLSWHGKPYDIIKENLQDLMLNYIFSFKPKNISGTMSIIRLQPAKVTKVGKEEYFIEEKNRGILFFEHIG